MIEISVPYWVVYAGIVVAVGVIVTWKADYVLEWILDKIATDMDHKTWKRITKERPRRTL